MVKVPVDQMVEALGKRDKKDVDYSEGLPNAHCGPVTKWPTGSCKNFKEPSSCRLVSGNIEPDYWCKLWESKNEA